MSRTELGGWASSPVERDRVGGEKDEFMFEAKGESNSGGGSLYGEKKCLGRIFLA